MNALPILAVLLLLADPPPVQMLEAPSMGVWRNARIETRTLTGSLSDAIRAAAPGRDPAWVAYGVRGTEKRMVCCWNSIGQWKNRPCRSGCVLEGRKDDGGFSISDDGECSGSRDLRVLFRVADGKIGKIRALSDVCPLDAGNLRVVWLEGVDGAKSAAFLEERIAAKRETWDEDDDDEQALAALAMHGDPAADAALRRFVAPGGSRELRKQAAFWLGNSRGSAGYETLMTVVKDKDSEFREHLTFCFSQNDDPRATETLLGMAKHDADSEVRGQALFWLAQEAGDRAAGAIQDAIEDDPDTEVKEAAVFALTQMPKDEGIPELIRVAKTNRNPEVRKQAVFWLGQSKDPRALDFIEGLLR
jgi:hypothetical protein